MCMRLCAGVYGHAHVSVYVDVRLYVYLCIYVSLYH